MASYEVATILLYMGLVVFCFYFANTFKLDAETTGGPGSKVSRTQEGASRGFMFFFRSLGFFLIWQSIGVMNNMASAASAPAGILGGLELTYTVFMFVFILLLFFMVVDLIIWLLNMLKDIRMRGRVV